MLQNHDLILFDLDGTISDPLEGIGKSINYALTHLGYEPLEIAELAQYVGPPLDETFKRITGNDSESKKFVAKYRERYGDVGYSENVL
jgi:phosphoglycolate phosphatase